RSSGTAAHGEVAGQHRLCEETVPLAQGHRAGLELLDEPEVSLRRLRGEEPEIPEPPTRGYLTGMICIRSPPDRLQRI
ncbi:MAG: hypothetical protein M0P22_09260, partial [Methanoculleus sp.]|nr:hypothetical protein [Methanoculleus sp.]